MAMSHEPVTGPGPPLDPLSTDWERALAVAAHPYDLEYGCAAAVARWTAEGKEVSYLFATRGEAGIEGIAPERCGPLREREQRASAAVVGVSSVDFLAHPDGAVTYGPDLRRDITAAVRAVRPQLVVTLNHRDTWHTSAWNAPDHRAVGHAVLDAVADAGNRWIFPDLAERGLGPWKGVRWVAVAGSASPTHAVSVTGSLERGVASLLEHRTFLAARADGDTEGYCRALVTGLTRAAGERFGGRPAVAFEVFPW
jgi:LmbE family N-acetylglucosaminyl deacetylase